MYSTRRDGEVLQFGTSGLLYRSNKLMYDRSTNSLWNQFTGEPAVGSLVGSGIKLEILPVLVTTWEDWLSAHPDTTVLNRATGLYPASSYAPEWNTRSIYYRYRTSPETMFPVWRQSESLDTKGQVLGLRLNGVARAYPLKTLAQEPVINDSLGGEKLVLVTSHEGGTRVYARGSHRFAPTEVIASSEFTILLADEQDRLWRVEEAALVQIDNPAEGLPRLPSHTAYWFGWYSFYPDTSIYGQ